MNKNIKSKNNIIFIVMAVLSISIILGTGAYAYYCSTMSGTISGTIAKWSFTANNQTETFTLDLGDLYPGKTGSYNIELSAEKSDLDVYYEIYFTSNLGSGYSIMKVPVQLEKCGIRGLYGTINAGQKINIPLTLNWPYNEDSFELFADGGHTLTYNVKIFAQQYTAYTGNLPIKILYPDFTYDNGYIYASCAE